MTNSDFKPFTKQGILKAREKHLGKVPKDQLYRVFPKAVDLAFKSEDLFIVLGLSWRHIFMVDDWY